MTLENYEHSLNGRIARLESLKKALLKTRYTARDRNASAEQFINVNQALLNINIEISLLKK